MNGNGYVELKKYFMENAIKHKDVAKLINKDSSAFSKKLNKRGGDFSLEEARIICEKYNLSMQKFFA